MIHNFSKALKRSLIKLPLIFVVFSLFLSCAGGAKIASSGLGKASDPVPFTEAARTGRLPSGLTYYLLENSQPEGRAFLTLAVNAGSVLESDEERGLAHFVEHMAFNGTTRFEKHELVDYLRSLGMRFGPEVNAYTSFDETVYGIEVPIERGPDNAGKIPDRALAVLDDWIWGVTFSEEDVESEKLVIMEEYRSRLGAQERIQREMLPFLFRGSPYAERHPIGLPEVIERAEAQMLKDFYKKWYRPENMAVIIVGDFDSSLLEASLPEHFPDHWAAGGTAANSQGTGHAGEAQSAGGAEDEPFERPRYNLSEPEKGSVRSLVLTDSELSQSAVNLYWKRKAEVRRRDLADYRESVLDNLAFTMLALRFEEAAAQSETPYVWAGAGMVEYGYSSGYFILAAQPKTASVKTTLRELLIAKESLSRYGFAEEELKSAKAYLLSQLAQMVSEKDRQPSRDYVDLFTRHFLKGESAPDIEWEQLAVEKLLPEITLRELNRRVAGYFADDDLSVIISAPADEESGLPSEAEIKAAAAEVRKAEIAPPAEEKAADELMAFTPEAGAVVSESRDSETGALLWKLANGAELILKETKNRNNEITLYAQARGGTLSAPSERAASAELAAEMLNVSGLASYSRTDLMRMLLDKQVSMSFWTQGFLRGFQGSAAVKDAKTLFEMLYLSFTDPRIDPEAVKVMLDQYRSSMIFGENDPDYFFGREAVRAAYGNPRFHPLELEDLEKADIEEALAFIRACLNPGDYTFVFTGNLDIPQLRSLAETYLASIPASAPFNGWADIDPERPSAAEKEIRKGKEAQSAVYMNWFTPRAYSEEGSAAASVLTEYLEITLNDEIRETLGGVYSVSSWVSLAPLPRGELSGGVYFLCDPKRAVELSEAVRGEFLKVAEGSVDPGVFGKAVEALIKEHEEAVQGNLYVAQSYANSAVIYRSPLSRLDARPALYRAVEPGEIEELAAELLDGGGNAGGMRLFLYPEL